VLFRSIEIKLTDISKEKDVQQSVRKLFGPGYKVENRYEQNQSLYSVMNLERWIIYGVLSLILVVGAFNMIGALTMLVLEKQKDIGILHAMGARKNFIQRIFLSEGFLLAIIGGGIGMLVALVLSFLQIKFHLLAL